MRSGRARAQFVLVAALALASLSSLAASASPYHPFDAQTDTASALEYWTEANLRLGQSFVPTADYTLTRVSLYIQDRGNTDALSVRVVPDAGGLPDEAVLLGLGTNDTASTWGWGDFDLTPSVSLSSGTRYWIVARSQGGNSHGYAWRYVASDAYPTGNASTAVGNAWTVQPGDFAFVGYGWTPPDVSLAVAADRAAAVSGDVVRYTITLENTGTEDASDVWVNATLDARLRSPVVSGPGNATVSGPLVTFRIPALPAGSASFTVNATAEALLDDGAYLTLPVTAEFSDGVSRLGLAATALVEVRAPRFEISLAFPAASARPGDIVTFVVAVTNTGREPAGSVWVNESLHPALTFLTDTAPSPPVVEGSQQSWLFRDVGPGTISFEISAQVDPRAADETAVTNTLSLDHTDGIGTGLVRVRSNTIWFRVLAPGAGSNPWLWGSFAISATIVAGTYLAFVRRRLRVEEIFLIHRSGVLLVHMSKSLKADQDTDILSGMFTAIMNFVRDAFHFEERQELTGIDLGRYHVLVRKGTITYLALVHSGKSTRWISRTAARAVEDIEAHYGNMLVDWDGDVRALTGTREILKGHFLSPTGPSRSSRWLRDLISRFATRVDQTFKPMRPL